MTINGWKTYLGGGLLIAWAIAGVPLGTHGPEKAIEHVAEGLVIIGIGHKIQKASTGSTS